MIKKYDGLYIFAGNAKDDVLEVSITKAVAELVRVGATIIQQDVLGRRAFARPIKKRDSGVYVAIRFEVEAGKIAELMKRYRLVEDVVRVQFNAVDDRREAKLAEQREAAAKREATKQTVAAAAESAE